MPCSSRPGRVERARPLLGTLVEIACQGLAGAPAHRGIDAAFEAIDEVHRLMSFHALDSDVTRLNQGAATAPVEVDPRTAAAIALALEVAAASDGAFDVTIADRLVAWGRLPRPPAAPEPDATATWRDIELLPGHRVRFHRPLWIDLGGLAKGFAVDRAIERVAGEPTVRWIVNAGGDLRVTGRGLEPVVLQTEQTSAAGAAVVELEDASLASSRSGAADAGRPEGEAVGAHVDGRSRRWAGPRGFVSVVAQDCAVADAMTKVVLVLGERATPVLRRYGATAFLQGPDGAWQTLGEPA
jgi:FAD:protein FMN transferase